MHQDIQKYMCTHSGAFERMEEFRYLGKTIMSENSIEEEMKSGLKSGNAVVRCRIFCLTVCYPKI